MANGVVSATIWANDDDAAGVFFAYRDECNYIRFDCVPMCPEAVEALCDGGRCVIADPRP